MGFLGLPPSPNVAKAATEAVTSRRVASFLFSSLPDILVEILIACANVIINFNISVAAHPKALTKLLTLWV